MLFTLTLISAPIFGQTQANPSTENWILSPGILGTIILIAIVVLVAVLILSVRLSSYIEAMKKKETAKKKIEFSQELIDLDDTEIDAILEKRKAALAYKLTGNELGSEENAADSKGIISKVTHDPDNPLVDEKKKDKTKS